MPSSLRAPGAPVCSLLLPSPFFSLLLPPSSSLSSSPFIFFAFLFLLLPSSKNLLFHLPTSVRERGIADALRLRLYAPCNLLVLMTFRLGYPEM